MTNLKATPASAASPEAEHEHHEHEAATGAGNPVDPQGGRFAFRATVFDADDLHRAHTRIAHEIVERNHGAGNVVLGGLYTRGLAIARRLAAAIAEFETVTVPVGALDVAFYRDDIGLRRVQPLGPTEFPVDIGGRVVVLVDDVLYTGRTVRAALDALTELGRPQAVQLAILVDRGHRELPIRPDFVGKNLPTQQGDDVRVRLTETDDVAVDSVELWAYEGPESPGVDARRAPTTDERARGQAGEGAGT